ncbi:MAG TPA: DUF929 family protein [Friedmanniella sp.]
MSGSSNASARASARARLAAEQARQQQRRRRLTWFGLPVALVVLVVAVLVVVKVSGVGQHAAAPSASTGAAADQVVSAVTSVPAAVLDQVGAGSGVTPPKRVDAPALTADGKPRVLYVGAEYCPYCAAERWAVVVAMSRFGTYAGLGQTASSAQDVFPSTPTLSFHGAAYTSQTVAFTGVETESNVVAGSGYAPLDTLSPADEQLFSTYNAPPYVEGSGGSIPFIDIGGTYLVSGASFTPQVLQGLTHEQVAAALSDPTSPVAKGVDGAANVITAAVCTSTQQQPAAVCGSAGVQAAAKTLG